MEFATKKDIEEIVELYREVIDAVNKTDIKLGWNIEVYPNYDFVRQAVEDGQMCIMKKENKIISAGVVNHNVNKEYDDIDWKIKAPREKIVTIHALTTAPSCRGGAVSSQMLADIEDYCRGQGDIAVHLDVIDTNIPAYKLYMRNGYTMVEQIKMYYEVVGTREFWMMEKCL